MFGVEGTDDLNFAICSGQVGAGLETQLDNYLREHPNTRLVIIDTLQKVRATQVETYSYARDKQLQHRYIFLDQAYERVKGENRELKAVADDYDALCRGFGREKIAASVQAIREQETAERMQRRSRRRHGIEAR